MGIDDKFGKFVLVTGMCWGQFRHTIFEISPVQAEKLEELEIRHFWETGSREHDSLYVSPSVVCTQISFQI